MNQILSIENKTRGKTKKRKNNNKEPVEISNIIKFFSISILIFGIFMIGSGAYSMYKGASENVAETKPVINVIPKEEAQILVQIKHDKELSKVTYSWNNGEATQVQCGGKKEIETTIEIPTGINELTIKAIDVNGQEIEHKESYEIESEINIELEPEGSNLKVKANAKNTIEYITYRWDEDEETKIDVNDIEVEETIEIPKGLHKLTVIVVDENNKTETKEQEVKGVTKPKLEVTTDGSSNFIIRAEDEQGLKRLELIINDEKYQLDLEKALEPENRKEFEYKYPIREGENRLEVTIYNESEVSETFKALVNK